jgi:succinate dehydrogenase cytochrome b subunit
MQRTLGFTDTSIGKKAIVAVTGAILFGYVILHMLGNLQVFLGPEALNGYARKLHSLPALLWPVRGILLVSVVLHFTLSLELARGSENARPVGYRKQESLVTTYAARSMKYTGPLLAAFILFHLAHFTWPGVAMGAYAHDPDDVYRNVVNGFQVPWVTALYVVAQVLLGFHLYHGAWSLFQSLGLSHPRYDGLRRGLPRAFAFAVVLGNISIPLSILAGLVR